MATIPKTPVAEPQHAGPSPDALLQVHCAEYQSLMNRETYWITLQFAMYSVAVLFVTLVPQLRDIMRRNSVWWFTALGLQIIAVVLQQTIWELLNTIKYIETRLRPLVTAIVGDRPFWGYEPYVLFQRSRGPLNSDMVMLGGANLLMWLVGLIAVLVIALKTDRPWLERDWAWLLANLIASSALFFQIARLLKLTRELFQLA